MERRRPLWIIRLTVNIVCCMLLILIAADFTPGRATLRLVFLPNSGYCGSSVDSQWSKRHLFCLFVGLCKHGLSLSLYLFKQCDNSADWRVNGAGFHHSHQHGFGLLNAWRLVNAAKVTHTPFTQHQPLAVSTLNFLSSHRCGSQCRSSCPIRAL